MTKVLAITSPGRLDLNGLRLMGASTKRDEVGKIGRFGSGLKYALAVLLREGYSIRLFIGGTEIQIATKPQTLRGQEFQVITIDGEATAITTAMGPDWKLWQAIRELYCNAKDEGQASPMKLYKEAYPTPFGEFTTFLISGPDVENLFKARESIFFEDKTRIVTEIPGVGRILSKVLPEGRIYFRGVLCTQSPTGFGYDYDLDNIDITEERLAAHSWQVNAKVQELLWKSENSIVVAYAASAMCHEMEAESYDNSLGASMSQAWQDLLAERPLFTARDVSILNQETMSQGRMVSDRVLRSAIMHAAKIRTCLQGTLGMSYIPLKPSQEQELALALALRRLAPLGISFPQENIKVARFAGSSIKGAADIGNQIIAISETTFAHGEQYLLETLIEEIVHCQERAMDCTRAMQDALLRVAAGAVLKLGAKHGRDAT